MNLDNFLSDALHEISRGANDKRHPFRFLVFNTMAESYPDTRMVVLRSFDRENKTVTIFTDYRSTKVQQLKIQPAASILLWHPSKKIQVKLLCDVDFLSDDERFDVFSSLPKNGQHSYNTAKSPGTEVDSLEEAHKWKEEYDAQDFAVLQCTISEMEVLMLSGKEHYRARYKFRGNEVHEQTILVP